MTRQRHFETLAKIAELRALERQRSDLELANASLNERAACEARDAGSEALAGSENAWAACHDTGMLDLDRSRLWGARVAADRNEQQRLERQHSTAQEDRRLASSKAALANQRADAADDQQARALAELRTSRQEAALAELADVFTRRSMRRTRP